MCQHSYLGLSSSFQLQQPLSQSTCTQRSSLLAQIAVNNAHLDAITQVVLDEAIDCLSSEIVCWYVDAAPDVSAFEIIISNIQHHHRTLSVRILQQLHEGIRLQIGYRHLWLEWGITGYTVFFSFCSDCFLLLIRSNRILLHLQCIRKIMHNGGGCGWIGMRRSIDHHAGSNNT